MARKRNMRSVSGKSWLDVRMNVSQAQRELKKMQATVTALPSELMKGYYAELRRIAWEARAVGQEVIRTAPDKDGQGRIETGKMLKSFWAQIGKVSDKKYEARVGWLTGDPGYSIFQEYGTKNGVKGMYALKAAQDHMYAEIRKLGKGHIARNTVEWRTEMNPKTDRPVWAKGRG